ncbi:MAG: hypothetical protein HYR60_00055 [Acidobacteria bacterium]|nr:hypothetical protein [Acidobacteriota bacterium]
MAGRAKAKDELDWSAFPAGAVTRFNRFVCLACIFDVFTKQLRLAPRTAYSDIKRHTPSAAELTGSPPARPYFVSEEKNPRCPYCNSAKRWHARLVTHRIEGGPASDAARRALMKSLPKSAGQFEVLEEKSTRQAVLYDWLDRMGRSFDFDRDDWLAEAARQYLARKQPKTDWGQVFAGIHAVRRSSRLEEGWEVDAGRLFLAPPLYHEVLLVQYLVSRSHKAGGRTFEGRLTVFELLHRLRRSGYLAAEHIEGEDQSALLDSLVAHLAGAEGAVKLRYLVDRREFLEKVKSVYAAYAA